MSERAKGLRSRRRTALVGIGALLAALAVVAAVLAASNPGEQEVYAELNARGKQTVVRDGVNWELQSVWPRSLVVLSLWTVRYSDPASEETRVRTYIGIGGLLINATGERLMEDRGYPRPPCFHWIGRE